MAGRQTRKDRSGKDPDAAAAEEPTAGEYAREAATQWSQAVRLAAANLRPRLSQGWRSVLASSDGKGGRVGDLADKGISKLGRVGSLASKAGVGSKVVERMRPDPPDDAEETEAPADEAEENGGGTSPIPIQESINVAVPVEVAYRLATTYQDYPAFIDRVKSAEAEGERTLELVIEARGVDRRLVLQFEKVLPNRRIDWRCEEEVAHLGMVTFHELAPRLTHIEVSIDREPAGLVENLNRRIHLTDRALRADLHRFKAYAELWEDPEQEGAEEEEPDEEEAEEPAAEGDEELDGEERDDQEADSEEQDEVEAEPESAGVN